MKKYGHVVQMVLGDAVVNALVVQSVPQADGEHLVVFYLLPSHEATALSGQSVDAAIKKDFVTPLTEGKTFGWKELDRTVEPEHDGNPFATDYPAAIKLASTTINQQADKITELQKENGDLSAELEGVKTELAGYSAKYDGVLESIGKQTGEIIQLTRDLNAAKTELATTTEGIDKQLQGIADATAAKEAAPELVYGVNTEGSIVSVEKQIGESDSDARARTGLTEIPPLPKEAAPEATALQNVVAENIQVPGSEPSEPDPSLEQGSVSTESLSSSESSTDLGSGEVQPSTAQDAPSPSLDSPSSDSSKESDTSTLEPQQ